jgi:adenylosuccinate synthase
VSRGASIDDQTFEAYLDYGKKLAPMVCDVGQFLETMIKAGKKILFEGAQGALLDIDHGAYPYVTSSSCVTAAAATGSGIGPNRLNNLIGVIKSYVTKVGKGPFPSAMDLETDEAIREKGSEWGATTGRPRKCGWLDLVALKYACQINGLNGLWINKSDILAGRDYVFVCTAYSVNDKITYEYPIDTESLEDAIPVYERLDGWKTANLTDLNFRAFIEFIENKVGCPVVGIGTGPGREDICIP